MRHYATKKTPAQLQREIDEVIAQRRYPTGPLRDAASLHDVWDPTGKSFRLTYLPYSGKNLYPSYSAYGYGSFEEFFEDRSDAKARAKQLRDEDRIEKFEIHEIVRPKTGGFSLRLVDEWDDSEKQPRPKLTKSGRKPSHTGKTAHSTMQRHHVYRVGKDHRIPKELRGKSVVYLGEKELPAGGGVMAKVALLRSDGSVGDEYLVREHHLYKF